LFFILVEAIEVSNALLLLSNTGAPGFLQPNANKFQSLLCISSRLSNGRKEEAMWKLHIEFLTLVAEENLYKRFLMKITQI